MNRLLFILALFVLSGNAYAQTTDFTFRSEGDLYCAPALIRFTQTSSGNPKGYLWDFGNGQRSNHANPSVTYSTPGTYRVKLIVVYENTTAEKTQSISILRSVNSSFTANRERLCRPGEVRFNATGSSNVVRHEWNFGDGSQVLSGTATQVSHTYTEYGQFTVTLTSYNETGCFTRSSRTIEINRPTLSGSQTTTTGCAPLQTQFNSSVQLPPGSQVSQYTWNFGDGTIINSNNNHPTHTYQQAGSFQPTLTILTQDGCTTTFTYDSILPGNPPTQHQAYTPIPVICASDKALFVSHATGATEYAWDFGNGNPVITTDTFIERKFNNLGIQQVIVTPRYNSCPGSPITLQVEIIGVVADYGFHNSCNSRETFEFTNRSQGIVSSYVWNVGAVQTPVYTWNMSRRFPQNQTIPVQLIVRDSITGCVDSLTKRLYTADPRLINPAQSICLHSQTQFRIDRTYANPNVAYTWNLMGQTIPGSNVSHFSLQADSLGIFDQNFAIINNGPAYCPDTVYLNHPIKVKGPQLRFEAPENLCQNLALQVNNQSRPYFAEDSIISWSWNMGMPNLNDNHYQPNPVTYPTDRGYDIRLSAEDRNGCKDTLIKRVNIRPMPFLWTIPRADSLCLGQNSTFIAYTSDQVRWSAPAPVNGLCSSCDTITVRPERSVAIQISSTNSYQCAVSDSIQLWVTEPFTARAAYSDTAICLNEKLTLHVEPRNKVISWSPADQVSQPNQYDPVVSPRQTTQFTATLKDSAGCFTSEANIGVIVKSLPTVDAGPDKYLPYYGQYTIMPRYSSNARYYTWEPTDSVNCAQCPNISGIAVDSRKYTVKVVSDSGCVSRDEIMIFVDCRNAHILLPKAFTPNNDRLNDLYRPITRGIRYINRFAIFDRAGQLMYEARQFAPNKETLGWDGRFRNTLQPGGGYVYMLEAVCDTGNDIFTKGSFILIR